MTDKTEQPSKTLKLSQFWQPNQADERQTDSDFINVCCLKWWDRYSPDYVNRLAAMVRRNLKRPHRFVCFTDDPSGIHPSIECRPILDKDFTGWWHKISFFRPDIYDLKGPLLFLDLDIVIVSELEPFFDHPGNFCIIRDWLSPNGFNSSVFRLQVGSQTYVYENFVNFGLQNVAERYPGDQEWISQQITNATLWPNEWCVSFKWQCALPQPKNPIIPQGAKIVVFHGKPDPHEAMKNSYRIYGPKYIVPNDNLQGSPASWIADFWNIEDTLENGDNKKIPMQNQIDRTVNPPPVIPPLNPYRFARFFGPVLVDCGRKWFSLNSAFAMCLNMATLRGEGGAFAEEMAKGLSKAPLEQAFYLYRTGGRIRQAMEMIRGPIMARIRMLQPLPSIVLDAVIMAKTHDPATYEALLQKIVLARPDLTMTPTAHAFLHYEILQTLGEKHAEALNTVPSNGEMFEGDIRIAGIITVRNEGALVAACVGAMLGYCDFVLIFDHSSNDGGPQEAQAQFGKEHVEILSIPGMKAFNEQLVWDCLFAGARERKATHIVIIDADERLGPALADPSALREKARRLRPGEALTVPFPQVFGDGLADYGKFSMFNDISRFLPPWKDLLYCDDGKALHRHMPLHNPRPPEDFPIRRHFVNDLSAGLLHFEKANPLNAFIKTDYYIAKELVAYNTSLPLVLARYLPAHIVNNILWDSPPPPNDMAAAPHKSHTRLAWQLEDVKAYTPYIPPALRFLFNLDYWA